MDTKSVYWFKSVSDEGSYLCFSREDMGSLQIWIKSDNNQPVTLIYQDSNNNFVKMEVCSIEEVERIQEAVKMFLKVYSKTF